jgi:hypothetical protein
MSELAEQLQKLISRFKTGSENSENDVEPPPVEKKHGLLSRLIPI